MREREKRSIIRQKIVSSCPILTFPMDCFLCNWVYHVLNVLTPTLCSQYQIWALTKRQNNINWNEITHKSHRGDCKRQHQELNKKIKEKRSGYKQYLDTYIDYKWHVLTISRLCQQAHCYGNKEHQNFRGIWERKTKKEVGQHRRYESTAKTKERSKRPSL